MSIQNTSNTCQTALLNLEKVIKSDKWFIPTNAINKALNEVKTTFQKASESESLSNKELSTLQKKITELSKLSLPPARGDKIRMAFSFIFGKPPERQTTKALSTLNMEDLKSALPLNSKAKALYDLLINIKFPQKDAMSLINNTKTYSDTQLQNIHKLIETIYETTNSHKTAIYNLMNIIGKFQDSASTSTTQPSSTKPLSKKSNESKAPPVKKFSNEQKISFLCKELTSLCEQTKTIHKNNKFPITETIDLINRNVNSDMSIEDMSIEELSNLLYDVAKPKKH